MIPAAYVFECPLWLQSTGEGAVYPRPRRDAIPSTGWNENFNLLCSEDPLFDNGLKLLRYYVIFRCGPRKIFDLGDQTCSCLKFLLEIKFISDALNKLYMYPNRPMLGLLNTGLMWRFSCFIRAGTAFVPNSGTCTNVYLLQSQRS